MRYIGKAFFFARPYFPAVLRPPVIAGISFHLSAGVFDRLTLVPTLTLLQMDLISPLLVTDTLLQGF